MNAAKLNISDSSQINAVKGMRKKPVTLHSKLCSVIRHGHPEFFIFFFVQRLYNSGCFFFLSKHFKSHKSTFSTNHQ